MGGASRVITASLRGASRRSNLMAGLPRSLRLLAMTMGATMFVPFFASAVGVGVTPSELDVTVSINQTVERELEVTNTSDEPGRYTVSADEYTAYFAIYPPEFDVVPNETQRVRVQIAGRKGGRFGTNLTVVGMPIDQRVFNAGSGVKVPVRVAVIGESS